MAYGLASLFVLLHAASVQAEPVHLTIERHGPAAAAPVVVTIRPNTTAASNDAVVERTIPADQTAVDVNIPRGNWIVDATGGGWWHRLQAFSNTSGESALTVPVWRSAAVSGAIKLEGNKKPDKLTLQFVPPETEMTTFISCPVAEGRFTCAVPAGTIELRVRTRGFIPRNLPPRELAPGQTADLGELLLRHGASISGVVTVSRQAAVALESVQVKAFPQNGDTEHGSTSLVAVPDKRGFFQIDGAAPGMYEVRAVARNRASSRATLIEVRPELEAHIEAPLFVDSPKTLTVSIAPPLDPAFRPWHATLDVSVAAHRSEFVADSSASSFGEWTVKGLQTGHYTLHVGPASGGDWTFRSFDLDADMNLVVPLASREVKGRIKLGDRPLKAKMFFGGMNRTPSVEADSDDDGEFRVDLPDLEKNEWRVDVQATAPPVQRTVEKVRVDKGVAIDLPLTIVPGDVVNRKGDRETYPLLNIRRFDDPDFFLQVNGEKDGTFAITGLDPGKYRVEAQGFLQASDITDFVVPEDGAGEPLHLVLKPEGQLRGIVMSALGPVPGASVMAFPTDIPDHSSLLETTNERGEFLVSFSPNCHAVDVTVAAPGFAGRFFHIEVPKHPITIVVDQSPGRVKLNWPASEQQPVLIHAGAGFVALCLETYWNGTRRSTSDRAEVMASFEPGTYTLCTMTPEQRDTLRAGPIAIPPASRCVSATLAPFGSITLSVPDEKTASK